MIEGKEVQEYFSHHPESVKKLEGLTFHDGEHARPLEVSDIKYISEQGWEGQPGMYAWYYPQEVPHYTRID